MPLTPNFTAVQLFGSPNNIILTDTSTGTDVAVTSRRVYIQMANGTYLVEEGTTTDYEVWDYSEDSITLDVLTRDVAVTITVQWLDSTGTDLYTKLYEFGFTQYNESFDYGLTQMLTASPLFINDNNFFQNKSELRVCIDSGNQALSLAGDLFAAQQCYDRATRFRLESKYLFNINS
jgi:hypothetical protein